jgi:hypothetical protein
LNAAYRVGREAICSVRISSPVPAARNTITVGDDAATTPPPGRAQLIPPPVIGEAPHTC